MSYTKFDVVSGSKNTVLTRAEAKNLLHSGQYTSVPETLMNELDLSMDGAAIITAIKLQTHLGNGDLIDKLQAADIRATAIGSDTVKKHMPNADAGLHVIFDSSALSAYAESTPVFRVETEGSPAPPRPTKTCRSAYSLWTLRFYAIIKSKRHQSARVAQW